MDLGQYVESYRFWDVVVLWGRETLQHEYVAARAMARGVVRDGLRVQSVDEAATPEPGALYEEFVTKQDFRAWIDQLGLVPPVFWFGGRAQGARD